MCAPYPPPYVSAQGEHTNSNGSVGPAETIGHASSLALGNICVGPDPDPELKRAKESHSTAFALWPPHEKTNEGGLKQLVDRYSAQYIWHVEQ